MRRNAVLVVGTSSDEDRVSIPSDWYTRVLVCSHPRDVVDGLAEASAAQPIDILDFFDHGIPGGILCGKEILFFHDGTELRHGADIAAAVAPLLAETAHVRLLGCTTALKAAGRYLLLALAKIFGRHCTVWGTLARISERDFDPATGFGPGERDAMFSSSSAVDAEAPSQTDRTAHVMRVLDVIDPA